VWGWTIFRKQRAAHTEEGTTREEDHYPGRGGEDATGVETNRVAEGLSQKKRRNVFMADGGAGGVKERVLGQGNRSGSEKGRGTERGQESGM